jgi:3-hydroxy-9,10-secoandrosta-1,3,5(10)-triene-9,17-dione monooxygenase reductase component
MAIPERSANELGFREAISHFATGVTVITTLHDGKPVGMTASAVTSLSLEPVLLLVCINTTLHTHVAIENSRCFVVNVLGEGQGELALHFARPSDDKFAGIGLKPGHELPVLEDAIAYFVCDVHERFPGGDHTIFTGLVKECGTVAGKRPLVYFKSKFGEIRDPEAEQLAEAVGWDHGSLGGFGSLHVKLDH